jgi:hypothetical protein
LRSQLEQLTRPIKGFTGWSHAEKIKFFGWYLHSHRKQDRFSPADIRSCYDALDDEKPSNVNPYIQTLEGKKPKEILRDSRGLYLPKAVRDDFEQRYGTRDITIQVTKLLEDLPGKVPDLAERTFLDEALVCFRHAAFRAAVVMTWNLAYHHLCDYVLRKKLPEFNARWPLVYQGHHKKGTKQIASMDDFTEELKESEVIEICNSAGIITKDMHRILTEKLGKRNSAAHPSSIKIEQLQAEAFIDDLVKNVVLKLA